MSQLLINDYLKQLDIIRRVSGSQRETIVREAFKDLLKNWGKQHNLIDVTTRMPWWVGAALAFVSYFVLHAIATRPPPVMATAAQMQHPENSFGVAAVTPRPSAGVHGNWHHEE